jgi:hypothetical protein
MIILAKKRVLILIASYTIIALFNPFVHAGGVNFGIISAVKSKVQELKTKKEEKIEKDKSKGSVIVPSSSSVIPSNLSVLSLLEQSYLHSNYGFSIQTQETAQQQLLVVLSSSNMPVLLSYVNPASRQKIEFSAKTSAKALVMINPMFLMTSAEQRNEIMNEIETNPDFPILISRIESLLVTDPNNLFDYNKYPDVYNKAVKISIDILKNYHGQESQSLKSLNKTISRTVQVEKSYPWVEDGVGNNIDFVNSTFVFYSAAIYPNNSTSWQGIYNVEARTRYLTLRIWPPGVVETDNAISSYLLKDGIYNISLTKGIDSVSDISVDLPSWDTPKGRAFLLNFYKLTRLIVGLFVEVPVNVNSVPLSLKIDAIKIVSLKEAWGNKDSYGIIKVFISMMCDNVDTISYSLWQSATSDASKLYISSTHMILENSALAIKAAFAIDTSVNEAAPFVNDWFSYSDSPIEYSVTQKAGTLTVNVSPITNHAPVISLLSTNPTSISTGAVAVVTCAATDLDGDTLKYDWSASSGIISGNGSSIKWTAPTSSGIDTVNCTVSDGKGGLDTKSVNVTVTIQTPINHPPTISSLTANPTSILTGAVTTITCTASDLDGDTLTYNWSAASVTISGTGTHITWTAPISKGTYSINCTISDGKGGSDKKSVNVTVTAPAPGNHAPTISSLTANLTSISTGAVTTITCIASDPDGDSLTYNWSAVSGAFSESGLSRNWTAPATPGTYTINCTVSDGKGGSDAKSVSVTVTSYASVNHPPNVQASAPSGSNSGTIGTSYTYSTSGTDPDGNQVKYRFDWGDGTTSDTGYVNSGVSASALHSWSSAGTYSVKTKVFDSKGAESISWSPVLNVTISGGSVPPVPVINNFVSPDTDGSYGVIWNSVSGATSYTLEEDDNSSFSHPTTVYTGANTASYTWTSINGTYYYRVKATNSNGSSNWSSYKSITVAIPASPVDLIVNGTFASGSSGWILNGNFFADTAYSSYNFESGYAYLSNPDGTPGNGISGWIYQTVTIPSGAISPTLKFYYSIKSTSNDSGDYLSVTIQNTSGNFLGNVTYLTGANANSNSTLTYATVSCDMSAYAGKTVRINFLGCTNSANPSIFRIDDVSLIVQ